MNKITTLGFFVLMVGLVESVAPSTLFSAETLATIAQAIGAN